MCVSLSTIFCVKGVSVIMYCPCPIIVLCIYIYMGGKGRRDVTHRSYNEYTRRVYTDHHINIHLFTCPYSFPMCISNNRLSCEHKARKKKGTKHQCVRDLYIKKKNVFVNKKKRPFYFFFPTVKHKEISQVFLKKIEKRKFKFISFICIY